MADSDTIAQLQGRIAELEKEVVRLQDNRNLSAKYLRAAQIAAFRAPGDLMPESVNWKELAGESRT